MAITSPHSSKRKIPEFIDVPPPGQGDAERKTFHHSKRIPSAITKLLGSSALQRCYSIPNTIVPDASTVQKTFL